VGSENSSPPETDQGTWREDAESIAAVDNHPDFKYRDKGGFMKFLIWTGVVIVVVPSVFLGGKSILKKKKGAQT